jgi:hypothetical protein
MVASAFSPTNGLTDRIPRVPVRKMTWHLVPPLPLINVGVILVCSSRTVFYALISWNRVIVNCNSSCSRVDGTIWLGGVSALVLSVSHFALFHPQKPRRRITATESMSSLPSSMGVPLERTTIDFARAKTESSSRIRTIEAAVTGPPTESRAKKQRQSSMETQQQLVSPAMNANSLWRGTSLLL